VRRDIANFSLGLVCEKKSKKGTTKSLGRDVSPSSGGGPPIIEGRNVERVWPRGRRGVFAHGKKKALSRPKGSEPRASTAFPKNKEVKRGGGKRGFVLLI